MRKSSKISIKVANYGSVISDILQVIKKRHPSDENKKDDELLGVLDINSKIVSIPDIIDRAASSPPVPYLLLRGFSDANMLILGL